MRWNDITRAMAACPAYVAKAAAPEARRACALPVWLEAPSPTVPVRAR